MSSCGNKFLLGTIASATLLALAGCGGGGGSSDGDGSSTASGNSSANASLSGQSYKGPTAGAQICAYVIDNAASDGKGAQVQAQSSSTPSVVNGCVVTANDGTFSLVLPTAASGDLIVESSGGTYCSDESVYNGTACAGGGAPIAMGSAKLRTVVATPASGAVANVPLTLLTTAAARSTGALSAGSFATAYAGIAAGFGVSETTPATSPASGALQSALTSLATYLGGDTALLDGVVAGISGGSITGGNGVNAPAELSCSPLAQADLSYSGMNMVSMPSPMPGFPPMVTMVPYTVQANAIGGGCTNSADGLSSTDFSYSSNAMSTLLAGTEINGSYYETVYSGSCGDPGRSYVSGTYAPVAMQYTGTQAIARSASADPLKAQEGTASKLRITLQPGGTMAVAQPTTYDHLFCRTKAADPQTINFQAYLTTVNSPLKDGSLSRLAGTTPFTGWTD